MNTYCKLNYDHFGQWQLATIFGADLRPFKVYPATLGNTNFTILPEILECTND